MFRLNVRNDIVLLFCIFFVTQHATSNSRHTVFVLFATHLVVFFIIIFLFLISALCFYSIYVCDFSSIASVLTLIWTCSMNVLVLFWSFFSISRLDIVEYVLFTSLRLNFQNECELYGIFVYVCCDGSI